MRIARLDAFVLRVPLRPPVAPYRHRHGLRLDTESVLVRLETDGGLVGWGETPLDPMQQRLGAVPEPWLRRAVVGRDPFEIEAWSAENTVGPHLASGVEMAMWDLVGQAERRPLHALLGGALRRRVEVAACMGVRSYDEAKATAREYAAMGFSTLKAKGGRSAEEDLETIRGVRDGGGDRLKVRLDPNMAYAPDVAFALARDLEKYDLEYLEQPMGEERIDESARLRRHAKTPVALNESVTSIEVVRGILERGAADVLLPDTYQCGGILAVKKVASLAEAAGVPCVFHSAHDLGPKTAAMLHVVASSPGFRLANDSTYYGLAEDVIARPFRIENGFVTVPEGPGLGIRVDEAKVRRYRMRA